METIKQDVKGGLYPVIEKVCNACDNNIGLLKDFVSKGSTFYSKHKIFLKPSFILASALIPISTIALLNPSQNTNINMPVTYEVIMEKGIPLKTNDAQSSQSDVKKTDAKNNDYIDVKIDFDKRELKPKIFQSIISAAKEVDFDPALLLTMAWFESKMDNRVDNKKSSAVGLFQFTTGTWIESIYKYGKKHNLDRFVDVIDKDDKGVYHVKNLKNKKVLLALRNNPKISAIMAAETMKANKNLVEDKIGNTVRVKDSYLIHVLGPTGASKFFENLHKRPNVPTSLLFPTEVKKNSHLFIEKKDDGKREVKRVRTISESHAFVADMISKQMNRYENMLKIGEDKLIQEINLSKKMNDEENEHYTHVTHGI